ncbi:MAG TPA: GTP 3',8-cyclase MoaA [Propionibacteriaceae bacterium]|nr:GTP 3',8-cyclase MoaA [Propionibacteriaceae bacterium]
MTELLADGHGRIHRDLRISLTDHCNLRCTYCMPAEGVPWLPRDTLLTLPELISIVRVAVEAGITEVRLTGGEPLLRQDIVDVVAGIASLEGPTGRPEVSMTTNGIGLVTLAQPLADAGLSRINISLDTLRPDRFLALARRDRLDDTLAGIEASAAAGLAPLKLNTVLMRGVNDDETVDLVSWAIARGHEIRFIEQMPLDAGHTWNRATMVTAAEVMESLTSVFELTPVPGRGAAPAERFLVDGGPATVGIIASVSHPFCGNCDRLRLTADGQLRSCLFASVESDLRTPLRAGASDDELRRIIHACLASKAPGHGINDPWFLQPRRPMSAIGG